MVSIVDLSVMSQEIKFLPDINGFFVKPVLASGIMGITCYFAYNLFYFLFRKTNLALLIDIFIGILVYFVFLFLFGGIKKADLKLIPVGNKIIDLMNKFSF